MKKIILFLLGIMLMHGADGQNSIIVNKPNTVSKTISTIIEEQIYPSTITCINSIADNVTFVLSNPNMQTVDGERAETSLVIICNDAENLQEGETEGE